MKTRIAKAVLFGWLSGMVLVSPVLCQAQENMEVPQQAETVEEAEPQESAATEEIPPTELDLGDYLAEMTVGEKQLLNVTILPANATVTELTYKSSNTKVATINGMGRIIAVKKGTTKITVSCGNVSADFDLTVKEVENTEVAVTELDLGDCPKEITIGSSQILSVAVIPANATETTFTYKSSNPAVASVNALGRLTANQLGTAEITVSCGDVKNKFQVTVVEDTSKEEIKEVQDIEIGNYEEELKVDGTITLSATVLPADATNATVTYTSSNPAIATVNSTGEVKGIAPGEVVIYVSAGNITKQAAITVKIATTAILLNSDYQVMKPKDTFQIEAKVQPQGATGSLTYKSTNPEIAKVSPTGLVMAEKCGSTAIAVSNGDLQVSVTVIVNENATLDTANEENAQLNKEESHTFPDEISVQDYPTISTEMLKYFYEKEKVLTIRGDGYTIYLDGKDIVNYENQLKTKLVFQENKEKNGFTLTINEGEKLCGKLKIDISKKINGEKYLYLYNAEKQKYQKLSTEDISMLEIDTAGEYLLASKQLFELGINVIFVIVGIVAVLVGVGVYIGLKKQYWFW